MQSFDTYAPSSPSSCCLPWSPAEDILMLHLLINGQQQIGCIPIILQVCQRVRSTSSVQGRCQYLRKEYPGIWASDTKTWLKTPIYFVIASYVQSGQISLNDAQFLTWIGKHQYGKMPSLMNEVDLF